MIDMIERVAHAMQSRRNELIAQPLSRIWDDLARAAVSAMYPMTPEMEKVLNSYAICEGYLDEGWAAAIDKVLAPKTIERSAPDGRD